MPTLIKSSRAAVPSAPPAHVVLSPASLKALQDKEAMLRQINRVVNLRRREEGRGRTRRRRRGRARPRTHRRRRAHTYRRRRKGGSRTRRR